MSEEIPGRAVGDAAFAAKALVVTAASAIPLVGGPIATAIAIWEGEHVGRRVEQLVQEVDRAAKRVERKLDASFIASDEFQNLAVAAVDAARRAAADDTRRLVAAILVGSATIDRPKDLEADSLLDAVAGLSTLEVRILRAIWDRHAGSFDLADLPPEFEPDLHFHLKHVESAGLIYEVAGPTVGTDGGRYHGARYNVTGTFDRLFQLAEIVGGG